ncbi:uncharacterized protein LOC106063978 isoform X1 [Biomphalaria glabrata]|uniref:Uncharacterized protein LOC106063978 isoform X1 n=4 Tax=Biomphalaria glabrata TaxID=6526 RepID=A0A9W2ZDC3_BIOGL|nr:uncharacterized protein LOC106063978 isoform X1 [Biomphalaria glabrata]
MNIYGCRMVKPKKFGFKRMSWCSHRFGPRYRLLLVLCLLFLCVTIAFWLHYRFSRPYYRGVEELDPKIWDLLGPQEKSTVKPSTTTRSPQIHIKKISEIKIRDIWTVKEVEEHFFRYLENKDVKCVKDARLGSWNDGGWNVCLSPPYKLIPPCVVYSFGIGDDWHFDESVANSYSCQVLAFDPSIEAPQAMSSPLIKFYKIGLGDKNEVNSKGWKMKTLKQHFKDTGFWGKTIDYVKMDIEYSEWDVLRQVVRDGALKNVKQLAFEIHTPELFRIYKEKGKSFPERLGEKDRADFVVMLETLRSLETLGFRKFNYRLNPFGNYDSPYSSKVRSCCYDLHYINTNFLRENDSVIHTKDLKIFH